MSGWHELYLAELLAKERTRKAEERYAELEALKESHERDIETHNLIADVERWLKRIRHARKHEESEKVENVEAAAAESEKVEDVEAAS